MDREGLAAALTMWEHKEAPGASFLEVARRDGPFQPPVMMSASLSDVPHTPGLVWTT